MPLTMLIMVGEPNWAPLEVVLPSAELGNLCTWGARDRSSSTSTGSRDATSTSGAMPRPSISTSTVSMSRSHEAALDYVRR